VNCEECGSPLTGGQKIICKNRRCFLKRQARRAKVYRLHRIGDRMVDEAKARAITRIPLPLNIQHASPERVIKIVDEIIANA